MPLALTTVGPTWRRALPVLPALPWPLVITDLRRGDDNRAGRHLIDRMRAAHVYRPTIVYSSADSAEVGVPPGAFGQTNLLHYVIGACERA